ncbi:NADPH-dependent diflavin oxidoreductase 1 [Rhizophlyctis rosea]|uniref:NADPH-dependent diflavin oxidoreductase 1 n=1 Tax=Rhizophlyctis rosea TaxID=64517 RepID=A0AAD5S4V9_9FUNG|nr:NADPH-dependent diflavin oxidoreductase 1 [Rhizophlyctis rosea]
MHKRLLQLGAQPLTPRGDGDDQHYLGVDGGLDPWLETLWFTILSHYPLPKNKEIISSDILPPPSFEVQFLEEDHKVEEEEPEGDGATLVYQEGVVVENRRLTARDHFQDVRHFGFAGIGGEEISYSPGDVMNIRPCNLPDEVQEVINYFGWQDIADRYFNLIPTRDDITVLSRWGKSHTIRKVLTKHLDIFGRPRRYFFELLSFFTTDPQHAEKLKEFASAQGQDELYSYCYKLRRTTFEVLQDFHSAKVPLKYLFDLIPEMRPRSFSISSSPKMYPNQIHLTVAIVKYRTKMKLPRVGVCTKWMAGLSPGDKVSYRISKGTMRLPDSPSTPVIMIGPGTGVAPMRAFLGDRILEGAFDNVLFFGCRNEKKDYLYQEEWEQREREGGVRIFTAFSRDQEDKIYVQHRIEENAELMWEFIERRKGVVLLSGNSKRMPTDVAEALKTVFRTQGRMTEQEAESYLGEMEKRGRFQQECWA